MSICLIIIYSVFLSCTNQSSVKNENGSESNAEITDDFTASLYTNYHQNPVSQAQKDENMLIDYAIDKDLNVSRTSSGLYYFIEKEGQGEKLKHGQKCKAHYSGYFVDGRVFDSSIERGSPIEFTIGQMNPGWNEGLTYMNIGTKAKLLIPSHLAYGQRGFPGYVPPNTPIIFDLEILPL